MKRKWKIQALKVTVTSLLPPIIVNQVSNKKTMETENELNMQQKREENCLFLCNVFLFHAYQNHLINQLRKLFDDKIKIKLN